MGSHGVRSDFGLFLSSFHPIKIFMKTILWLNDKRFWRDWIIQAGIALILFWVFVTSIFSLTFANAGLLLTLGEQIYLTVVYLVWIWFTQFIAFCLVPTHTIKIRWLIIIGAYVGVGAPIGIGLCILRRFAIRSVFLRWLLFVAVVLISWKIFSEIGALYSIFFTELLFEQTITPLP